jgi:hypothetical protein
MALRRFFSSLKNGGFTLEQMLSHFFLEYEGFVLEQKLSYFSKNEGLAIFRFSFEKRKLGT